MLTSKLAAVAKSFPAPAELERRYQILTVIEAITSDSHGDYRHYAYSPAVGKTSFRFASFISGSGDHATISFHDHLTLVCAFDHESPISTWTTGQIWPGLLDNLPSSCAPLLDMQRLGDPVDVLPITSALWHTGAGWEHGNPARLPNGQEPDPTFWMFDSVVENFSAQALAEQFSIATDASISPASIEPILEQTPLTDEIIHRVNPDACPESVRQEAASIGYGKNR